MPSPLVTATIQNTLLNILSNILAQSIQSHQQNTPLTSINPHPILLFALYALLSTPPNFLWQDLLESHFPSYPPPPPNSTKKTPSPQPPSPLSKSNLLKKFLLDQAISAPLNTLFFLAFMKGFPLPGHQHTTSHSADVLRDALRDFPQLHLASLKVWPAVGLASFVFVPVGSRILFGGVVALGWNVYLSLLMGTK